MTADEPVLYERDNAVVRIRLNRPDQLNAINDEMREALFVAFRRFEADERARVAILSGVGRSFCAGADLKEMSDLGRGAPAETPHLGKNLRVTKPTIAQVHGHVYAGGFLLAQMCDLCVAADGTLFGLPEVKRGRGAPWATPLVWMLPQRIVMELLLTGEPLPVEQARDLGFVNRVCSREDLDITAHRLAETIAANAPLSVEAGRRLVYLATEAGRSAALELGDLAFEGVYKSDAAKEGPRAFASKRAPVWGRDVNE